MFTLRGETYYYHGYNQLLDELTSIFKLTDEGRFYDTGHKLFGFDVIDKFDICHKMSEIENLEHVIYFAYQDVT